MRRTLFLAALGTIAVLALFVLIEMYTHAPGAARALDKLPEPSAKAVDILLALTSLFVTLALAVFGGIGFFVKGYLQGDIAITAEECVLLAVSGAFGLISIFAGHLTYSNLVVMLSNSFLVLDSRSIVWPVRIQYIALVLSVLLFFASLFRAAISKLQSESSSAGCASESNGE
jgi:hypothetical protein